MLVTATLAPPIWAAISPYTFSAATTLIGAAWAAEMPMASATSLLPMSLRMGASPSAGAFA